MAVVSHTVWVPLLLVCGLTAFSNTAAQQDADVTYYQSFTEFSINATCAGHEYDQPLQQALSLNTYLERETTTLSNEVDRLRRQLATCGSSAPQTQIHKKMRQLLGTSDSENFLLLKIITLTREVMRLQVKLNQAANSTDASSAQAVNVLSKELEEKTRELNTLKQQLQRYPGKDGSRIYDIITLQNQIWNLDQSGGETAQSQRLLTETQTRLDLLISQLPRSDVTSALLELISVQGRIARVQGFIRTYINESRGSYDVYERQLNQKLELLKKKILELNKDVNNPKITREILKLQAEIVKAEDLMAREKKTSETRMKEIRFTLEELKKKQQLLQKQLEEADYIQAQLILRILSTMKEIRDLDTTEAEEEASQTTNLQTLLQAKDKELTEAQGEIKELERVLLSKGKICYKQTKAEFNQLLSMMNAGTGDTATAPVLTVIRLQEEINNLEDQIARTRNQDKLTELKNQLEAKQMEMFSKIDKIKMMPNTNGKVLEIINRYKELFSLQKSPGNETSHNQLRAVQDRLGGLIGGIGGNENMKTMLKVTFLQNQVDYLKKRLSNLQSSQTTYISQLQKDLTAKNMELQQYMDDLTEKNQTNARLVSKVAELHNLLRNVDKERSSGQAASSLTISQLKENLMEMTKANIRDHANIKVLQIRLQNQEKKYGKLQGEFQDLVDKLQNIEIENCTSPAEKHRNTKTELERTIEELNASGNSTAAKIFSLLLKRNQNNLDGAEGGYMSEKEYQDLLNLALAKVDRSEATRLIVKTIKLWNQMSQLEKQSFPSPQTEKQKADIMKEISEVTNRLKALNSNTDSVTSAARSYNRLRETGKELQELPAVIELKEKLGRAEALRRQDQAAIRGLQEQLNVTEARCPKAETEIKGLKDDLDLKIKELQSKSDVVSSLALQVSTLNTQVTDLNSQLLESVPGAKLEELQKLLKEKNAELANKTRELTERSGQPQRLLQIIKIQGQIDALSKTAKTDMDFSKIKALQQRLQSMIGRIEEDDNDNTKLMFIMMAQRDEIAKLKMQEKTQTQANTEKIKDLEDKVKDFNQQIKDKTQMLDSSGARVSELTAQIMALYQGINTTEKEIANLRDENANKVKELTKQLALSEKKLKDTTQLFQETDRENNDMIMEVLQLKEKLKKAQKGVSDSAKAIENDLQQQIEALKKENRRLETANDDLKQQVQDMDKCRGDSDTQCEDLQRQLEQSNKDSELLLQQIREKSTAIEELTQQLQEQAIQTNNLVEDIGKLESEKTRLENVVGDLNDRLSEKEETTINPRTIAMDPNTANARVRLSEGYTRLEVLKYGLNVQDHPGRFDVSLATLGKTGYSAGKNYWEVNVGDQLCYHIGVASESAQRKGIIPFGPGAGYWTIILNKQGQFRAIDKAKTVLPVETKPVTLGILLDYNRGQVSIYDVGSRSHMYSFTGQTFTDTLYPFINFCEGDVDKQTSIQIISPGSTDWIQ